MRKSFPLILFAALIAGTGLVAKKKKKAEAATEKTESASKAEDTESCKAKKWNLKADDSTGRVFTLDTFTEPVQMLVYAGKNTADTNEAAHDALKNDKDMKKGGPLNAHFRAYGIANYQETWVPNWLISYLIKRKIEKYKVIIWNDKDNCFSGQGKSSDCMVGYRRSLFVDGQQNTTFLYNKYFVKRFVGKVDKTKFVRYTKELTQAAKDKKEICWVLENIKY